MSVYRKKFLALFTIIFLSFGNVNAQYEDDGWEAGIGVATMIYQGDLAGTFGSYKRLKPAINLYGGKMLGDYFSVRVSYTAGKISADDADYASPTWRRERNLHFSTSINELTAKIVFKPYGSTSFTPNSNFYPYVFAGAGVAFVRVKRDWSGITDALLQQEKTATDLVADTMYHLPGIIQAIPVGAGMGYRLSPAVSLFGELTYHLAITDYLDGFSHLGNTSKKDNYYMLQMGVHCNFSLKKNGFTKCPPVN